jgi:arsenate reductase-like glutaredoxin family protein
VSCSRSQEFLARNKISVKEEVDAKAKLGRADALRLAAAATKIHVAKGKKVTSFDMRKDPPGKDALLKAMLGPTGNLRAPVVRKGKTLLVGFNADLYAEAL